MTTKKEKNKLQELETFKNMSGVSKFLYMAIGMWGYFMLTTGLLWATIQAIKFWVGVFG